MELEGMTRFVDGMRVTREHMEHMQSMLFAAAVSLRKTLGAGKVCYGLKVESVSADRVSIGAGLAFDSLGRPLVLGEDTQIDIDFGDGDSLYLALAYSLRSEELINGVPTMLFNDVNITTRVSTPPYPDDAIIFAKVSPGDGNLEIEQKGEWYLPRLDHEHSGRFILDEKLRWRYDGHPLGFHALHFDSGFINVAAGERRSLLHGFNTSDLLVQIQARSGDGVITTRGSGQEFWYELVGDQVVNIVNGQEQAETDSDLLGLYLRVKVWPLDNAARSETPLPLAQLGGDFHAEYGDSFVLDGSGSLAFGGRQLKKYIWTQLF